MTEHGAGTIKEWMEGFVELARSGREFGTSAGAEPHRQYAYLEYHIADDDQHSILVFGLDEEDGRPTVRAHLFRGSKEEVRERVDAITHDR